MFHIKTSPSIDEKNVFIAIDWYQTWFNACNHRYSIILTLVCCLCNSISFGYFNTNSQSFAYRSNHSLNLMFDFIVILGKAWQRTFNKRYRQIWTLNRCFYFLLENFYFCWTTFVNSIERQTFVRCHRTISRLEKCCFSLARKRNDHSLSPINSK